METLSQLTINNQLQNMIDKVDHAAYTLDGVRQTDSILKHTITDDTVDIYVYFDETVVGEIANIQLEDSNNQWLKRTDRTFIKPANKTLYVRFRYTIKEVEDDGV